MITSQPKSGKIIQVEVPTHVAGVLDFSNGAVGTIITSFDVWKASLPRIEIYGSEASLSVPDPNTYGGPVQIFRPGQKEWEELPLQFGHDQNSRSLGVADMASAIRSGRLHRASGEMCYHVLDIMHAFHDASLQNHHVLMESSCERPAALPLGLPDNQMD
jgi:predicted dehydrogenase